MNIKIGHRVVVPDNLLSLFGGIHVQVAIGAKALTVEQKGVDWIVFRDTNNNPWYIDFDRQGYAESFLKSIRYI